MRSEDFITLLTDSVQEETDVHALYTKMPLGIDAGGAVVFSHTREKPFAFRNTCVTGSRKTSFIKRVLLTLSHLYAKEAACFLILSPRTEYGELLRLYGSDFTVPFLRNKEDLEQAKACVKDLISLRDREKGCPRLILVLDGLEEIEGCNTNLDLEEYRDLFELVMRRPNVDIISGADLTKSIFSGQPGVFVGVGNCLVTTIEEGKADVTYVDEDMSLSMPTPMQFPQEPSITETVIYLNALKKAQEGSK